MRELLRRRALSLLAHAVDSSRATNQILLTNGIVASRQIHEITRVKCLADIEFGIFSQWGEDGILEWIIHFHGDIPRTFVEFGVENYRESNTRFLLQHRNWRGLVIDGSQEHVDYIRNDEISWKHDLTAVARFITSDNIDDTITVAGFTGDIGVLSVDIDGNDYWVWKAISNVKPHIVVAEYNSAFGDIHPVTIPYHPDFFRTAAHSSNLYYGASIRALEALAFERGYTMLGCNGAGTNVFFVRDDCKSGLVERIADRSAYPARARESRGANGEMTLVAGPDRAGIIAHQPVENVKTGTVVPLADLGQLISESWHDHYAGAPAAPTSEPAAAPKFSG